MVPASGIPLYYAEDMLGSSRVVVQSNGTLCYDADFTPYGAERPYISTCPQNFKFEGKERDPETLNDDFGARKYTWRFGRWLSSDWSAVPVAVPYANLTNPQTLNLYSMVADDPESFADLDGHNGNDAAIKDGKKACPHCPGGQGNTTVADEEPAAPAQNKPAVSVTVEGGFGLEYKAGLKGAKNLEGKVGGAVKGEIEVLVGGSQGLS